MVFTVDIRSPEQAKLDGMRARIEAEAATICEALGRRLAIEAVGHFDPVTFAPKLRGAGARRGGAAGLFAPRHRLGRGARRLLDQRVAPTTMVMCPCVDGLSHNEAEEITPDWAEKGANVLFHAVLETAEIVA